MNVTELDRLIEDTVAPVALSNEYCRLFDAYDNSGFIYKQEGEVTGVVFALDLTKAVVQEAKAKGYNVILTHHPAIFGGIKHLSEGEPLVDCIKAGISVISMHLNFDCAERGIDHYLMEGLGGSDPVLMEPLSVGGYGRLAAMPPVSYAVWQQRIKETFRTDRVFFYGDGQKIIARVLSLCGAGCSDEAVAYAIAQKADAVVSADMKHHHILALTEAGIAVVQMTHYACEVYGFHRIAQQIQKKIDVPSVFITTDALL